MYYLANLRNKVVINQFLLDTLFKAKRKNKRISYTNSKFYIGYDVFRILTSYQIWTHVLIVLCVWTRMSYPIGYKAVESSSVYKHIYFRWNNANYKKNKKLIILMFLISKMHKKHFMLCLICIHSALRWFFSSLISSNLEMWRKTFLMKYKLKWSIIHYLILSVKLYLLYSLYSTGIFSKT